MGRWDNKCTMCNGRRYRPCPKCRNQYPAKPKCKTCQASGVVECGTCHGTGRTR